MPSRKTPFGVGEYYHVYNRGVDKRKIFMDYTDLLRFEDALLYFNTEAPVGSLHQISFGDKSRPRDSEKLVEIVSYCLNPNHYHLLLHQEKELGISKFMQRVGGGYTRYFNEKYNRKGSLFSGAFKATHIPNDDRLCRLGVYVSLNNKVHKIPDTIPTRNSWNELGKDANKTLSNPTILLSQFNSLEDYKDFAETYIKDLIKEKEIT